MSDVSGTPDLRLGDSLGPTLVLLLVAMVGAVVLARRGAD